MRTVFDYHTKWYHIHRDYQKNKTERETERSRVWKWKITVWIKILLYPFLQIDTCTCL